VALLRPTPDQIARLLLSKLINVVRDRPSPAAVARKGQADERTCCGMCLCCA